MTVNSNIYRQLQMEIHMSLVSRLLWLKITAPDLSELVKNISSQVPGPSVRETDRAGTSPGEDRQQL